MAGYRRRVEAVVCEGRSEGLLELADEFVEDPGCLLMIAGADDDGIVLFTVWQDGLAQEVAAGLVEQPAVDVVRYLQVPEGAAFWS